MTLKFRITDEHSYGDKKVVTYATEIPTPAAVLAEEMLCRWGPVLAEADGEDSAGRQKLRSMTVDEIVTRACDIALTAYQQFEARGMFVSVPDLNEVNADKDAERIAAAAKKKALETA